MKLIDKIPFQTLIVMSIFLALAPFPLGPAPHLWEKLQMLMAGNLVKPADIFDVVFHLAPATLLAIKVYRKNNNAENDEG